VAAFSEVARETSDSDVADKHFGPTGGDTEFFLKARKYEVHPRQSGQATG
jgi:hypothetical protein